MPVASAQAAQLPQEELDKINARLDALENGLASLKKPSGPAPVGEVPFRRGPGAAQHAQFATSPARRAELEKQYGKAKKSRGASGALATPPTAEEAAAD